MDETAEQLDSERSSSTALVAAVTFGHAALTHADDGTGGSILPA
jgi:hypothetical protein